MSDCLPPDTVNEAFLAAPALISQQILDLTVQAPSFLADAIEYELWPVGGGAVMEQLVFRGEMPQVERGFDKWKKVNAPQGCDPCEADDCSYNWSDFGGHGFERRLTELMRREFRSPKYCINEIQSTMHFKEVFAQIIKNLYRQVSYFKEQNIALNALTMLSKKFVVDSGGAKINPANPYVYRNIGSVELSVLNIEMLEFFYEHMRRTPDALPYDVVDGSPVYALMASHQLISRVYRDDPNLRADVRFSGMANDNLTKYNFMSTFRGMFMAAPILYPRRFNIVAGEPVEVLPTITGIPMEVGTFAGLNPAYEETTHEEVLILGKSPFKLFYQNVEQSLPGGASFGPEDTMMNSWKWVNPETTCDPFRRVGYFATAARMGISQQHSEGVYAILVPRPSKALMAKFAPVPECPPEAVECTNEVPDAGCPCPIITDIVPNPMAANNYYITFSVQVTGEPEDAINLQLDNGGMIVGELVAISEDLYTAEISFVGGLDKGACTRVVGLYCDELRHCSATVDSACDCRSGETDAVELTLSNMIRADVADTVLAYMGDGTEATLTITAIDAGTMTYTVGYAAGFGPTDDPEGEGETNLNADMICDRGGVIKVCVPPSVDATCPACSSSLTACS